MRGRRDPIFGENLNHELSQSQILQFRDDWRPLAECVCVGVGGGAEGDLIDGLVEEQRPVLCRNHPDHFRVHRNSGFEIIYNFHNLRISQTKTLGRNHRESNLNRQCF